MTESVAPVTAGWVLCECDGRCSHPQGVLEVVRPWPLAWSETARPMGALQVDPPYGVTVPDGYADSMVSELVNAPEGLMTGSELAIVVEEVRQVASQLGANELVDADTMEPVGLVVGSGGSAPAPQRPVLLSGGGGLLIFDKQAPTAWLSEEGRIRLQDDSAFAATSVAQRETATRRWEIEDGATGRTVRTETPLRVRTLGGDEYVPARLEVIRPDGQLVVLAPLETLQVATVGRRDVHWGRAKLHLATAELIVDTDG